jgi:S-adenosylmethionine/arginine decarboxylase-like enzyme
MKLSRKCLVCTILGTSLGALLLGRALGRILLHLKRRNTDSNTVFTQRKITLDASSLANDDEDDDIQCLLHQPSGTCQNIFLDINAMPAEYLQSESQLIATMVNVSSLLSSSSILSSPRCYPPVHNNNTVLRCEFLLLNAHIRMWTWPDSGVMSWDILSCEEDSLVVIVPQVIRQLQAHGSSWNSNRPLVQWEYKIRGFRNEQDTGLSDGDIGQFLLGWMEFDMKELVVSVDTDYQTIEIYDVINPRFQSLDGYRASLVANDDGSYESKYPELFRPDRVVYLDGIMLSRYYGDAAYHEALVHPAMITHTNPKRVAIIGGGEGATLREVLKYHTVETVTMIEIDELMVNVSKQYLPEWSDCSRIVGSVPSCFDDVRAEIICTDAVAWFMEGFFNQHHIDPSRLYDVIIMDALYVFAFVAIGIYCTFV